MRRERGQPLPVVFCWHMHQPEYRDPASGQALLPWTYLHATKDYTDMAAHLAAVPGAHAVVNLSPVLLEQLADLARGIRALLARRGPAPHPLLGALAATGMPAAPGARRELIADCTRLTRGRGVERLPQLAPLLSLADFVLAADLDGGGRAAGHVSDQYLADLLVGYHLAWFGEDALRSDARLRRLVLRSHDYTTADRLELLTLIAEAIESVPRRYRTLAENGTVELAMNPYAHPIAPLLLDVASAREAMPDLALPAAGTYPGGEERLRYQVEEGLRVFERHMGCRPTGFWPAEGAVCTRTLGIVAEYGFAWAASGRAVLVNSLHAAGREATDACTHRPYRIDGQALPCFFRDDGLSDLIGFAYARWRSEDAVDDLVHHLHNIADHCGALPDAVASIIVDGENAWEHYAGNGQDFLRALYARVAADPALQLTTFSQHLRQRGAGGSLPRLVAGSWVYGALSTWVGNAHRNRAWDWLIAAKRAFDAAAPALPAGDLRVAQQALAMCECSDWFWWLDDHHDGSTVSFFERLYCLHLQRLYALLDVPLPAAVGDTLARDAVHARHGPMLTAGGSHGG
jgi:alpha-amylase/alpha-mannosidase (GH57 family)